VMRPRKASSDKLARQLRQGNPSIIGIIRKDLFCLDFRTIQPDELPEIIKALRGATPK
jgi:seryl-tRNA(Sec) selenium transferase